MKRQKSDRAVDDTPEDITPICHVCDQYVASKKCICCQQSICVHCTFEDVLMFNPYSSYGNKKDYEYTKIKRCEKCRKAGTYPAPRRAAVNGGDTECVIS